MDFFVNKVRKFQRRGGNDMSGNYYYDSYDAVNSYQTYMKQTAAHRILTIEDERKLAMLAGNGDKAARDELISCNMRFVMKFVRENYHPRNKEEEMDLFQSGALGLTRAVDHFCCTKGFRLTTYAKWWIRKEVDEFLGTDHRVRITPYEMDFVKKLKAAKDKLKKNISNPGIHELSEYLGWSIEKTTEVYFAALLLEEVSYDKNVIMPDGKEASLLESGMFCSEYGNPDEEACANNRHELIRNALLMLSEDKREIIVLHYFENIKYNKIANIMGLKNTSVQSVANRARKEMKNMFEVNNIELKDLIG